MAGKALQVRYAAMHTPAVCATSCACAALRPLPGAQPAERWTLWVKRTDVEGARYAEIEGVDSSLTVSKLIARWVSDKKLDVDTSLVKLRLVTCASGDDPSEAQEQAATELSPRRTLREAGVADGGSLLACFAAARRSGSGSPGARPRPCCGLARAESVRAPLQLQTARAAADLHASRVRWPTLGCSPAAAAPSRRARRR